MLSCPFCYKEIDSSYIDYVYFRLSNNHNEDSNYDHRLLQDFDQKSLLVGPRDLNAALFANAFEDVHYVHDYKSVTLKNSSCYDVRTPPAADYLDDLPDLMYNDGWLKSYISALVKAIVLLRKHGIRDLLPETLSLGNNCSMMNDQGEPWGHLRSRPDHPSITHLIAQLLDYNYEIVDSWLTGIGGNSYSIEGVLARAFWFHQRSPSFESYYWPQDWSLFAKSKTPFNVYKDMPAAVRAWSLWHGYTLEILSNVSFPNNDRFSRSIRLLRTEVKEALRITESQSLAVNESGILTRSVIDPTSCFAATRVSLPVGITITEVPHHRVLAMYMQEPFGCSLSTGAFKDDEENEFQAILAGLPSTLVTVAPPPRACR
jgi:hypothetical protein